MRTDPCLEAGGGFSCLAGVAEDRTSCRVVAGVEGREVEEACIRVASHQGNRASEIKKLYLKDCVIQLSEKSILGSKAKKS